MTEEEIYAGTNILIMGSCWQDFPSNTEKPAGYDEEVNRISHREQSCQIAMELF